MNCIAKQAVCLALALMGAATALAQQASAINILNVPTTVRVNTTVTFSGAVVDAWNGAGLPGRIVNIEVGERYYASGTSFGANGQGRVSRTWRFSTPGRYRVSFKFNGDGTFTDSRETRFITVTR